ncbi:MAG: hypothetical protein O3A27_00660 [Actinomycetota bacterium]|nr:hypothetical protein [Actinomycetota bacterium]
MSALDSIIEGVREDLAARLLLNIKDEESALMQVSALAKELAAGVRQGR